MGLYKNRYTIYILYIHNTNYATETDVYVFSLKTKKYNVVFKLCKKNRLKILN